MQVINTYKCNIECDHCLFSCGPKRKGIISDYHFEKFIEQYNDFDLNYCGGETFLHPSFDYQLRHASLHCENIRIVTNGLLLITPSGNISNRFKKFIKTLEYMKYNSGCDNITVMVSDDAFHQWEAEKNDRNLSKVIQLIHAYIEEEFFGEINIEKDNREQMLNKVMPLGRAVEIGCYDYEGSCFIEGEEELYNPTIDPFGNIYGCCNAGFYLGNIDKNSPDEIREIYQRYKPKGSCLTCRMLKRDERMRELGLIKEKV